MLKQILLIAFSLFSVALFSQDVPEVQKPLVTKLTATWCINCGTWGWELFEGIEEDNTGKALLLKAHFSGDLDTPVGDAFTSNFSAIGQPKFILNNEDQRATRNNVAADRVKIADQINQMSLMAPVANMGFFAEMVNGKIEVQTKTKFFQEAQGEYYLSLYVVEDDVTNNQSGIGVTDHTAIIRTSFDADVFGTQISMMNTIGEGMEFTASHSIDIDASWNTDNLYLAGMIWKKEGGVYQYVNGNQTDDFSGNTSSVSENLTELSEFTVFPSIIEEQATISFDLEQTLENVQVNIVSLSGNRIKTIFDGSLSNGPHNLSLNRKDFGASGSYFVSVISDGKTAVKKVIVN